MRTPPDLFDSRPPPMWAVLVISAAAALVAYLAYVGLLALI
jgi:hypothetical protein